MKKQAMKFGEDESREAVAFDEDMIGEDDLAEEE